MNWFLLSFLSAFFTALSDALSKKSLLDSDEYLVAWVRVGFSSPFLLFLLPFIKIPELDRYFFLTLLFLLPLEIIALILYVKAIKLSPLSLTLPFLTLTPVFMIFTSNFMLGEKLDKSGIIGILLTAIGAYLLHVKATRKGIWEPFKAIGRERGSVYMIIVAFIYSITSNLGKTAVLHSSPLFFSAVYFPVLAVIFFPVLMWKNTCKANQLFSQPVLFGQIGLTLALATVTHFLAVVFIEVSYVISIRRTSLLFGIMYGALWFKEADIKERLIGAGIMVTGVVIITIF